MNTDIRISTSLLTNQKIRRLIRRKGHEGLYNIISLWTYAAIHRPKGYLYDMDNEDLMDAAGTKDEKLIELLVEIKLLDVVGFTYQIHNWEKHNQWACGAEKRTEDSRKAAKIRWMRGKKESKLSTGKHSKPTKEEG